MAEMISVEEARELVLSHMGRMPVERVALLDALGRVAAEDLRSDIDVAPFAHSAMDGFAVRSASLAGAAEGEPVDLSVIAEVAAGSVYEGPIGEGECVRIMTGAPLPSDADAVVKYEVVETVEGDGREGSIVRFSASAPAGANVRGAGEEARAGEVIVSAGDVIGCAGVGFMAGCGITEVPTYERPRVAIIATGSELVDASEVPGPGKIRNSNSYAMAACAKQAGCIPVMMPFVADTCEGLAEAVAQAARDCDFVVTTGGAANGDFDFIKKVIDQLGELLMTTVNMRPGKAQAFGLVEGTPVFGLPGNPAAAYCGFEMLVRPGLRAMQGYRCFEHPSVTARLAVDQPKRDPRRILLRSTLERDEDGSYVATPAANQSSGLFGVIQKTNCLAVMPEGLEGKKAGEPIECILLDVPEEVVL